MVRRDDLRRVVHVTSVGYNTAGGEVDSVSVTDALVVGVRRGGVGTTPSGSNDEESLHAAHRTRAQARRIREFACGNQTGRTSPDQITMYESVGVATQDVAATHLALTAARERSLGLHVDISA